MWVGEDFLCSSVFSISVWSSASPMWWTNDFSTLILWVNSGFCKLLPSTWSGLDESQFSLSSVTLPPTLPHRSAGNSASFHTFCLWKSGSSAAHLAQNIGLDLLPASPSGSFYPQLPHCGKTVKVFKIFPKNCWSCGMSSPAVSLSERFASLLTGLGWHTPPRQSLMKSLILVSQLEKVAWCLQNTSLFSVE